MLHPPSPASPCRSLTYIYQVQGEYPFIKEYDNAWPVNMLIMQYLNNHRANLRAKAGSGTAGPSTGTPGPDGAGNRNSQDNDDRSNHGGQDDDDPGNHGGQDDDKSDGASISGIDSN